MSNFLRHRKLNHKESTPICKQFRTGECPFGNNKRWFIHEKDDEDTNIKERKDENLENNEIIQKNLPNDGNHDKKNNLYIETKKV